MTNMNTERKYLYSFDALKGIAIMLAVVFGHYWQFTPGEYWSHGNSVILTGITNTMNQLSFKTYSLMELLFMISGFQMWSRYDAIANGEIRFGKYMSRTAKRLLPMSMITTIAMALGMILYQNITGEVWYNLTVNWKLMLENLFEVQAWVNNLHSLNGPLWYVSVYFLCRIIYYLLIRLEHLVFSGKKGIKYLFMILPIALGIYGTKNTIQVPLLNIDLCRGYVGFFLGVLVAAITNILYKKVSKEKTTVLCVLSISAYFLISLEYEIIGISSGNYISILATCIMLYTPVLILLFHWEKLDRIVGNKVLASLGKVSFDIYVWNFPFCLWILIVDKAFHLNIPFAMWYMLWVQAGLHIVIGILSWRYVDRPLSRILDRLPV